MENYLGSLYFMQLIISNQLLNSANYPFISQCHFLVSLQLCQSTEPVQITLPTEDPSIVSLVLTYLRYGCLPHRMDTLSHSDLELCLSYLGTDDVKLVSFCDKILNRFTPEDASINRDTSVLVLYSTEANLDIGKLLTRPLYPVVLEAQKSSFRYPKNIYTAFRRMFQCQNQAGVCRRLQFIKRTFEILDNVVLAGGALQFMLSSKNPRVCHASDLDFFVVQDGLPVEVLVHQIAEIYQESFGDYFCLRTEYAVTFFKLRSSHRNVVQLILKRYESIAVLLSSFDIDASCFAFDGVEVVCNRRGLRSWLTQHNTIDVTRQSPTYVRRLLKYHQKYGFGIVDPGFIPSRVNLAVKPWTGLASLLSSKHQVAKSGSGYGDYSVCDSRNLGEMTRKIQKIVNLSQNTTPFVLRYKNSDVFLLNPEEKEKLPTFTQPDLAFQYPTCSDPWYAQAYGQAIITVPRLLVFGPKLDWTLNVGLHTLSRSGLTRKKVSTV